MSITLGFFVSWLRNQFASLPYPTTSYSGQTIIITGANSGLGLEAARHFVRLEAHKVIIAGRSGAKGKEATRSIERSTGRQDVIELWNLNLTSYTSVKTFAERASKLDRLDVLVNNAGVLVYDFELAEDNESTITVNVTSAMLLSLLLLPKLRETSIRYTKDTFLTFTGSFTHFMTKFPEQKNDNILGSMAIADNADMANRYYTSKLIQLLVVRELADQVMASSKPGSVVVSVVNPGFVKTSIMRHAGILFKILFPPYRAIVARSAEVGSRTLMHGAAGGRETHGQYLDVCAVAAPSAFVTSAEGVKAQKQLWHELTETLGGIVPGIVDHI